MATDNTAILRVASNRPASILERIPASRWGKPVDLKGAVIFFALSTSDYLNGAIIPFDEGWLANMNPDRFLSPDPATRDIARYLYQTVASLPIGSPRGHVACRLFSDPSATFGTPAELFIVPDHCFTCMLYSQGIPLESLLTGDHRKIWSLFCENFHLFRGTPSGIWLMVELTSIFDMSVFGVDEKPSASNPDRLFDSLSDKLSSLGFSTRPIRGEITSPLQRT